MEPERRGLYDTPVYFPYLDYTVCMFYRTFAINCVQTRSHTTV